MNIKENLQIILITYNRKKYLQQTFEQIFANNSPIRDFAITILDNKSTDGTSELIEEYKKKFPKINHIIHNRNIGGNANIVRAFEFSSKKYLWILCDDDNFDWTHWNEVVEAMQNDSDIICICHHILNNQIKKQDISHQLVQLSLLPAGIYKTTHFDDTLLRNLYDNIYTMFPHLIPVIYCINNNGKLKTTEHEVLKIGINLNETDCSYIRGNNFDEIWPRNKKMLWFTGFSNICSALKNKKILYKAFEIAIKQPWVFGSFKKFSLITIKVYRDNVQIPNLVDSFIFLSFIQKLKFLISIPFGIIFYGIQYLKKQFERIK